MSHMEMGVKVEFMLEVAHLLQIGFMGVFDSLMLRYLGMRWDHRDATQPGLRVMDNVEHAGPLFQSCAHN